MARPKSGLARNYRLEVAVTYMQLSQVGEDAKAAKLSLPDYVRLKLGLPAVKEEATVRGFKGDPENAVDVEELAKQIYEDRIEGHPPVMTMAEARRKAKRRLQEV